ncbi:SHOCT domain-containing protein [Kribbella sp. NPDC048928]|uniref:SHOCT domain-containing protein n=1 Tax=Kribbella sp. NPDC048928 TaxID=3364111 RepID=UPI0037219940
MMYSTSGATFWMIAAFVVWILLVGGATWATVRVLRQPHDRPQPSLPSPLDILERRYAAGDITREDFDEARARLRERQLDV